MPRRDFYRESENRMGAVLAASLTVAVQTEEGTAAATMSASSVPLGPAA
jgi:hypothetical protein